MTEHPTKHIAHPFGWDGPAFEYRGSVIASNKQDTITNIAMPGHPFDGKTVGNVDHAKMLIDAWQDKGRLPAPYERMNPKP